MTYKTQRFERSYISSGSSSCGNKRHTNWTMFKWTVTRVYDDSILNAFCYTAESDKPHDYL